MLRDLPVEQPRHSKPAAAMSTNGGMFGFWEDVFFDAQGGSLYPQNLARHLPAFRLPELKT
jgi:hypothetical protein